MASANVLAIWAYNESEEEEEEKKMCIYYTQTE